MLLLGASVSPFVRKVLVVAAEKGIPLGHRQINPSSSDDADFLACSPFRKIPALLDGDFRLADSTAIVNYLEAKFPATPVIPLEPRARGMAIWFEEVADTILFPAGQKVFFNRIVAPKFLNLPGDEAAAAEAVATQLPPVYQYLESMAPASGYFVGDSLNIGDISIACMLVNMSYVKAAPDAATYPKLAAWFARMAARPSLATLIEGDLGLLGL
jgi:glutathione S-transferase